MEPKGTFGEAAPTMLERQMTMPKKSNTGMMAGIAAAVVLVLGIGGFMLWKSGQTVQPPPGTVAPSTAVVNATAPPVTNPSIPDGKGRLLLSASPWAELEKIEDDKGNSVTVTEDAGSTPARVELPPGDYKVTLIGPANKPTTYEVHIKAGEVSKLSPDLGTPNLDDLQKEVTKQ
jgi:hypothetical protein